jgi:hypothetical protein
MVPKPPNSRILDHSTRLGFKTLAAGGDRQVEIGRRVSF